MTIAALETCHKGYVFRSRLEARVAILLDEFGWTWRYEPEGFKTPYGNYLPDFEVLSPQPMWIEVKGKNPTETEKLKLRAVAHQTCTVGLFFVGSDTRINMVGEKITRTWEEFADRWDFKATEGHLPFEEPQFPKGWVSSNSWDLVNSTYFAIETKVLRRAYTKAKSARFGT